MADNSKDTGTGGINIDGEVYTADVGVPDGQGGPQGPYSSGDVAVDKVVKDISKPTRETFAKYLSKSTLAKVGSAPHKNTYPVGSGDQTEVSEISLRDTNGNPVSPGPQNNEAKFATGFNNEISSNNPAGIKKGLAAGSAPDGNTLLPNARQADGTLVEPLNTYTSNVVDRNLYDYDSSRIEITDGTLNLPSNPIREIRTIPDGRFAVDGGSSQNILSEEPDYALTDVDRFGQPGSRTSQNFFPIEFETEVVKPWDASNKPISVTAAQNNITNANFFTRVVKIKGDGDNQEQVVSALQLPTYTDAYLEAVTEGFEIKRGQTAAGQKAVDGNKLLASIAPLGENNKPTLTPGAQAYLTNVVSPNLHNDGSAQVSIPEYEAAVPPAGIRTISVTQTLEADGGTSKNIFNRSRQLTLAQAAAVVKNKTADNDYAVYPNVAGTGQNATITLTPISAVNKLASTGNNEFFADVRIGSYSTVNSKGKLKNGNLPDGNSLLPGASTAAPATSNDFIKFVSTTATTGLVGSVKDYTSDTVKPNLFDFDSLKVGLTDGTLNTPSTNIRSIKIISPEASAVTDGGTSKNILGDDSAAGNYTLTTLEAAKIPAGITPGFNVFSVDDPVKANGSTTEPETTKIFDPNYLTPLSVTALQANIPNSKYFTRDLKEIKGEFIPISTLPSSYTRAYAKSIGDTDESKRFGLARGRIFNSGPTPDGHKLLSSAVIPSQQSLASEDFIKLIPATSFSGLNAPLKTYVTNVLDPNLYSPFDAKPPVEIVLGDGANVIAKDYPLSRPTKSIGYIFAGASVATDGGTSKNILSPAGEKDYRLTEVGVSRQANAETTINFFKIDLPATKIDVIDDKNFDVLTSPFKLKIEGKPVGPAESSNAEKFASINVGVNDSPVGIVVNTKGSFRPGTTDQLPTGHELLLNASLKAPVSPDFIKFGSLQGKLSQYTEKLLFNNLYEKDYKFALTIGDGGYNQTPTQADLHPTNGLSEDAGKSSNILILNDPRSPDAALKTHTLNLEGMAAKAAQVTGGSYNESLFNVGPKQNSKATEIPNVYSIDAPALNSQGKINQLFSITIGGYPRSPSDEQASRISNSEQFVYPEGVDVPEGVKTRVSLTRLQSSYSNEKITIKRGKSAGEGPDGHELLRDAAIPSFSNVSIKTDAKLDAASPVSSYTSNVLAINRYGSSKKEFVPADTPGAESPDGVDLPPRRQKIENIFDDAGASSFISRTVLYSPDSLKAGESPATTFARSGKAGAAELPQGKTFRQLTRIGTILQLRAAGEITFITGDENDDPRSNTQQLAALLPGAGQVGAGIPFLAKFTLSERSYNPCSGDGSAMAFTPNSLTASSIRKSALVRPNPITVILEVSLYPPLSCTIQAFKLFKIGLLSFIITSPLFK